MSKTRTKLADDRIRKIPVGVHPLIESLYRFVQQQELTYGEWSGVAGVSIDCLRDGWRRNRNPSLLGFIAAGEAVGYRLRWERIPQAHCEGLEIPSDPEGPSEDNFTVGDEISISELIGD